MQAVLVVCGEGGGRGARQDMRPHLHIGLIAAGFCKDARCRGGCQVPILRARCSSICLQQGQEVLC